MSHFVVVNGLTVVHRGSNGVAVASAPDVCWTPTPDGMKPLPYPNSARSSDLVNGTTTVTVDGNSVAVEGCAFGTSTGDEAGTGGGVVSGVNKGKAKFSNYSFDVMIEGRCACRLGDPMVMNVGGKGPQTIAAAEMQAPADGIPRKEKRPAFVPRAMVRVIVEDAGGEPMTNMSWQAKLSDEGVQSGVIGEKGKALILLKEKEQVQVTLRDVEEESEK